MDMTHLCTENFCSALIDATTFNLISLTGSKFMSAVSNQTHLRSLLLPLNELPHDYTRLKNETDHIGTLLPS